ncbi:MAG: YggT family protein [bacterium]
MPNDYFTNPLVFLIQVLFGLYTLAVMLRFLLQVVRADFYNPVSQFIVKVTTPVVHPLRKIIPGIGSWDTASLALAWLLSTTELLLILLINGKGFAILPAILLAVPHLVELVIHIFLFAVFVQVIISWISPGGYNPAVQLLYSLTEPLMRPARNLLPPISGIDLSPMLVIVALYLLKMLLIPPLEAGIMQLLR